jgi:predicted dehydrogenase
MKKNNVSRRRFIGTSATAVATFNIVPRHVLGGPNRTAANDRLNIAGIGAGGKGSSDLKQLESENIVALCDVDKRRAAGSFNRYSKAKQYSDFRVMLKKEEKNIDAVCVATPDHMHAPASMMAIKMGKHVYCEKPLTKTVYEARAIAEAAKKHGVATQMGNQGQAGEIARVTIETIQDGALGAVTEIHAWTDRPSKGLFSEYWPQGVDRPKDTPPVPAELEWDIWLGPAPQRPYHPAYLPFVWRGWWDFGTGALGDIGCHNLSTPFKALKLGHPSSVQAASSRVNKETYPLASMVTYEFPKRGELPPLKLVWYDGGLRPPRPAELEDGRTMGDNGILYVGDKGKMLNHALIPETRRKEYGQAPKTLPRSSGHHREWIDACKGGKPAGANFVDHAGPLAEMVLLGNVALRSELRTPLTKHKLLWDGPNQKFTNLPEANHFLHYKYRDGWTL